MSVDPNNIMRCEKCYVQSYDLIFLQCENCGHMTDKHKELVGENRENLDNYLKERRVARKKYEDRVWRNEE